MNEHDFYKTGDSDVPKSIVDRNGEVVLQQCRSCGRAEAELDGHPECDKPRLPRIYCFQNVVGGGEGLAIAIAEDGKVLATHWCSNEHYAPYDLGVHREARPEHHDMIYSKHYPNGYVMEFVATKDAKKHEGLQAALEENMKLREAAEAEAAK